MNRKTYTMVAIRRTGQEALKGLAHEARLSQGRLIEAMITIWCGLDDKTRAHAAYYLDPLEVPGPKPKPQGRRKKKPTPQPASPPDPWARAERRYHA